jgi:error-prone DNA polymerase
VTYTELQVTSHFSFLRGASSAEELFAAAANLGYKQLGITDRNSVAGIVRAHVAAKATEMRLIPGCRLDLMDGSSLLVWPQDRAAWSRLTRLLSLGKSRADPKKGEKGQWLLHWEEVAAWGQGAWWRRSFPTKPMQSRPARVLAPNPPTYVGDRASPVLNSPLGRPWRCGARSTRSVRWARRFGVSDLWQAGDVLYHRPTSGCCQDVGHRDPRASARLTRLGFRASVSPTRCLKGPAEMERAVPATIRTPSGRARTSPGAAPFPCASSPTNIPTKW